MSQTWNQFISVLLCVAVFVLDVAVYRSDSSPQ